MASKMMADQRRGATAPGSSSEFATIGEVHDLRYAVRATLALLHYACDSESDDDLVGVRFVLQGVERHCGSLGDRLMECTRDEAGNYIFEAGTQARTDVHAAAAEALEEHGVPA